jgi:hypothetical protein
MENDSSNRGGKARDIVTLVIAAILLAACVLLCQHNPAVKSSQDRRAEPRQSPSRSQASADQKLVLSAAELNMPVDPVYVTNQGFQEERSLRSRLITLACVTNFVANARRSGLGVYSSGSLEVRVRSGANNVAYAKTANSFFDLMYSDKLAPSVLQMDSRGGRDAFGLPIDVNEFTEDPNSTHVDALRAWANTNNYPYVSPTEKIDAAVAEFLAMQIEGFADRYKLESREQVERGGYKTPFVKYTYAANSCFKNFSNMNRDAMDVTLRMGDPDLPSGGGPVLVNYGDPGVVWRMVPSSLMGRSHP